LPDSAPKIGLSAPKIHSRQNTRTMERSLLLFGESIKTEVTFQVYQRRLKEFMSFCNVSSFDDLTRVKNLQESLEDYVIQKKQTVSPNSVPNYFWPIKTFCESNEIELKWKKIQRFFPSKVKTGGKRPYTAEDVQKMLDATTTYGSELAPQVQQLRELRDNTLLQTESGTSFMNNFNQIYYSFSPIIADYERENPIFLEMVKVAITPMISSMSILNHVEMSSDQEVLGYGISLILLNIGMYVGIPVSVIVIVRNRF
jgi:hypothetical protein